MVPALGVASAKGRPLGEPRLDHNFAGIKNLNNYTGYTYDYVLDLYFAQNRFYNADTRQFITQDPIKDGMNWYVYCDANPLVNVDWLGLYYIVQRVKFIPYSQGSGNGYLQVYDDVKIVPETAGSIKGDIALKNIPWIGTMLADGFKPGLDISSKVLVHGREYYLIVGGTSFSGKSALETYPNTLKGEIPNAADWQGGGKIIWATLFGEGASGVAARSAEKRLEGLGNIAGKFAAFAVSMSGVSEKINIADQDQLLMGLLYLSKAENSFTCVGDAEKTMNILQQLTEIEELKQYMGYTNGRSLFLTHLQLYKSDNPDRLINEYLIDVNQKYKVEVRNILESYKKDIETITQVVNYVLEKGW